MSAGPRNVNRANGDRPLASVSLDLDNQWSYMKTHGDPGWESFPSYLDTFTPHAIALLRELELGVTVFIVGQDAAIESNHAALTQWVEAGHDVGNHSFHHEQWFHLFSRQRIETELNEAHAAIVGATGREPRGYRGPGFSWCDDLLHVLGAMGYTYDASILPTYIGPLARMYYMRSSPIDEEEKQKRSQLFGSFSDGLRPVKPYYWDLGERRLLEIPVTTIPVLKTPFHLSYLLYLSRFSHFLMATYLRMALTLCRLTRTEPSFLLHPLDLVGGDQLHELAFFPGMDLPSGRKTAVFRWVLQRLARHFQLVDLGTHAEAILARDHDSSRPLPRRPVAAQDRPAAERGTIEHGMSNE